MHDLESLSSSIKMDLFDETSNFGNLSTPSTKLQSNTTSGFFLPGNALNGKKDDKTPSEIVYNLFRKIEVSYFKQHF